MPKFLILMAEPDHFRKWEEADESLQQRVFDDFTAFDAAVKERGALVAGEALSHPNTARTVQPGPDGSARAVTEGPYAETVEQVGGFYLIDVPDLAVALELAAFLPREYALEVRECLDVTF